MRLKEKKRENLWMISRFINIGNKKGQISKDT